MMTAQSREISRKTLDVMVETDDFFTLVDEIAASVNFASFELTCQAHAAEIITLLDNDNPDKFKDSRRFFFVGLSNMLQKEAEWKILAVESPCYFSMGFHKLDETHYFARVETFQDAHLDAVLNHSDIRDYASLPTEESGKYQDMLNEHPAVNLTFRSCEKRLLPQEAIVSPTSFIVQAQESPESRLQNIVEEALPRALNQRYIQEHGKAINLTEAIMQFSHCQSLAHEAIVEHGAARYGTAPTPFTEDDLSKTLSALKKDRFVQLNEKAIQDFVDENESKIDA